MDFAPYKFKITLDIDTDGWNHPRDKDKDGNLIEDKFITEKIL